MDLFSVMLGKKLGGGGAAPVLIDKNITENGTYNASSDNAQGYSKVVVDVAEQNNARIQATWDPAYSRYSLKLADGMLFLGIPDRITLLQSTDFNNMTALKELVIPSSVKTILDYAFSHCPSLEKITINKAEGSITGAPWGAPASCQIIWNG